VGRRENPSDSRRHGTSGVVKEHGGASSHPLDRLVEDRRWRNGLASGRKEARHDNVEHLGKVGVGSRRGHKLWRVWRDSGSSGAGGRRRTTEEFDPVGRPKMDNTFF
jgi:hypothetical protein